jgi:hypothetical protein
MPSGESGIKMTFLCLSSKGVRSDVSSVTLESLNYESKAAVLWILEAKICINLKSSNCFPDTLNC